MALLSLALVQCFGGVKNTGKVVGYRPGVVLTKKSFYNVGILPEGWNRANIGHYNTISFYNESYKSTIETDAYCDKSFDDASLKVLTTHLYFAITDKKERSSKPISLDGRAALHSVADGKVDGVPIVLDTVVIKKDDCLFDFAMVSAPSLYAKAAEDFKTFFEGFKFSGDLNNE